MDYEQQKTQLQAMLDKVTDSVKATAEKSDKELKNFGVMAAETKATADKLLTEQSELRNRMSALEQSITAKSGDERAVYQTAGERVTNSDEFAAFAGGRNAARMTVSLGGGMGVFNTVDANAVTSIGTGGTSIAGADPQGIKGKGECRLSVRDLLMKGRVSSGAIEFVRNTTFTNNADGWRENPTNPKPQSALGFQLITAPVVTIAHYISASKQVLADVAQMQSFIDGKLRYGLAEQEEAQLLKGGGASLQELAGLYANATSFSRPTGMPNTGSTLLDTLRSAILQAELACYYADGIVLSTHDWARLEVLKDNDGRYIMGNPFGAFAPTVWGRTTISSKALDAGEWLVGAFGNEAQLFDREDASVTIGLEDGDNLRRNMVTLLAEQREVLAIYQTAAFIKNA